MDNSPQVGGGRLSQARASLEQVVKCPRCGSVHFTEHTYQRYKSFIYGSAAGADLQTDSVMPQVIRVCLCGWPYEPNISGFTSARTKKGQEQEGFTASLLAAQATLNTTKLSAITEQMATLSDISRLQALIENLTEQIYVVQTALSEVEVEPEALPEEVKSEEVKTAEPTE